MDSLRVLRDSLDSSRPPAGPSKRHEKRLNQEFKAAALHLTNLYRNSLSSSQSSHRLGYLQGLSDILDLILLRSSSTSRESNSILDDAQGEREASHKELLWLVQYLRARIEAIKSDGSDDDDLLDGEVDQHPTSSQPSQHRSAATRGSSAAAASSSQRATSSTPGLPIDQDDERHSPAVSTAPNTPGPRSQRMDGRESRGTRSYESSGGDSAVAVTPARQSAPSSSFSFQLAPSPIGASSPFLRRKTRGISAQQGGGGNNNSGILSGRGAANNVGATAMATNLSPVGEERSDSLMDEDMREDRGHGRRGPVPRSDGDRGKRRRKLGRGASSSGGGGAGGGGGTGGAGAGAGGQGGSSGAERA